MTKKALEVRIEQLEKEIAELKAQLLSLALRPPNAYIPIPTPVPYYPPLLQPHPWYEPRYPIITYGNSPQSPSLQQWQNGSSQ